MPANEPKWGLMTSDTEAKDMAKVSGALVVNKMMSKAPDVHIIFMAIYLRFFVSLVSVLLAALSLSFVFFPSLFFFG